MPGQGIVRGIAAPRSPGRRITKAVPARLPAFWRESPCGRGDRSRLQSRGVVAPQIHTSWESLSPNHFKQATELWPRCHTLSSIRVQEGQPHSVSSCTLRASSRRVPGASGSHSAGRCGAGPIPRIGIRPEGPLFLCTGDALCPSRDAIREPDDLTAQVSGPLCRH
jgi:hypothetical protein